MYVYIIYVYVYIQGQNNLFRVVNIATQWKGFAIQMGK